MIYDRLVFNQRCQKEGERIDSFVSDLKRLALTCEFGSLKDSLIRDRIVGGVISDDLRGELLKKPDLTFQQHMTIAELLRPQSVKSSSLVWLVLQVRPLLTYKMLKG